MKIDLPAHTDERNIYIFAGIELIQKRDMGQWLKKVERCTKCGKCCMNVPADWSYGEKDGNCKHLILRANEYLCKLGSDRPFNCCISDGQPDECDGS